MKFCKTVLSMLALTAFFTGSCLAQSPANDIDAGRALFMKNGCYSCHGTVGQGGERGAGPRIAPGPYPFEAFKILVRQPREAMPRFDVRFLSDEQSQLIHHYLVSIPPNRPAAAIEQLRAACPSYSAACP